MREKIVWLFGSCKFFCHHKKLHDLSFMLDLFIFIKYILKLTPLACSTVMCQIFYVAAAFHAVKCSLILHEKYSKKYKISGSKLLVFQGVQPRKTDLRHFTDFLGIIKNIRHLPLIMPITFSVIECITRQKNGESRLFFLLGNLT